MLFAIDARLVSYIQGGTSRYTTSLVQAMARIGAGGELLVLEARTANGGETWPEGVRRARLMTPPHHRLEQLSLPVELMRFNPDLLHSTDFIPPFRRPCRSVITIHDLAFMRYPHLLTAESERYYSQVHRAVRSADRVIAVSEATRRDVLELLGANPDRVKVVYEAASPDCVPLSRDQIEEARARLGLPKRFILFVGTIEPRKNLPVLLKAFAKVWRGQGVSLVVAGRNGWLYEDVFRTKDSLGLGQEVRFAGPVAAEELVHYYNAAECLVLPSLYEGFGLPVLEAMACGTPVIGSNVSSLPEIAGDAGLTFEPEDVDGLANALERVLSDQALKSRLREEGIRRAAQFSWERAARGTLAIYRETVS